MTSKLIPREYFRKQGAKGGKKGGKARMNGLTAEERRALSALGGKSRWKKKKKPAAAAKKKADK